MSTAAIPSQDEWVSGLEARRIAGVTWYMLLKLTTLGKVATLAEPGEHILYRREDLERVAGDPKPKRGRRRA